MKTNSLQTHTCKYTIYSYILVYFLILVYSSLKMTPIAHFNRQPSLNCDVNSSLTTDCKEKFEVSHLSRFNSDKQVNRERSAAVEFASSQWNNVINRAHHYVMSEEGTLILVKARPSSHLVTATNVENINHCNTADS